MIYFKRVSLLILLIFVAKIQFSQCTTCNTTVTNNAVSQYNVAAGTTLCIGTGLTYTGTINLNGGTLCNSGVISKVNFNSGTFQNYGTYSKNGNLTIQNTGNIIVNNYSGSEFRVIGNLDIQSSSINTSTSFNLISGKTSFDVTGNFNSSKGILSINPNTDLKQFSEGVFFNIGKDFYIGGNATLNMNIGQGTYFNVGKVASFDGRYNKTINNYGGVININSSFNIGGNGQNTGVFTLFNGNKGALVIRKAFNASYNNGTVNIINNASIEVGTNWTQSKDVTTITNNGNISITRDLNIERGSLINNGTLYTRDADIKFGSFTNNKYAEFSRDMITSNNAATITNNAEIRIKRELNNKGTVNLGQRSITVSTDFFNQNNGLVKGPLSISGDSTNYAFLEIARTSSNSGDLQNHLVVYDLTNNNSVIKLDFYSNINRLGLPLVIIGGSRLCGLYRLDLSITSDGKDFCIGKPVTLYAYAKNNISGTTLPVTSYTWNPGNGSQIITTVNNLPITLSTSTIYTVTIKLVNGCVLTNTLAVNVLQQPTISYVGSPFFTSITSPINVIQTGSSPGIYSSTPSGLTLNPSTGAISPSLSAPGTYTIKYLTSNDCNYIATTVVEIKRSCEIKVNAPIELQLCLGDLYNLSATGANLDFTWVPSTGLSCTSCSSPVLTVNAGVTTYTVYGTKIGDNSGPCGFQVINVIPNNNCSGNTINGCCFSNYGAAVYVASYSTSLNVYCNLVNELGQFTNGNIKKGEFINKGNINVALDWIHNAQNNLYLSNEGITDFFGLAQNITGNSHTHFNRLDLTGNGIKTAWLDEYANSNLNLTTNEFHIQDNVFFMKNATAVATNSTTLITGTGTSTVATAIVGGGFVSTLRYGYLSRMIQASPSFLYLFPMGTRAIGSVPSRYRPIEINNNGNSSDEISVNFMNTEPTILGASDFTNSAYPNNDENDKAPSVSLINSQYYHKIKQTSAPIPYSSNLQIKEYYPSGDGSFQSLSEWEKDPSHATEWWGSTQGAMGSNIPAPSYSLSYVGLINALTNGTQTFDGQPFTLAQSGPYVNTGDFGGDGTVVTVTSVGSTPSTTSTTTYTNGTTSSTVTSTSGGVTTSTITSPTGATTTVTVTTTTSGGATITTTTTTTGGTTSTSSSTTTTTDGVTTSTTTAGGATTTSTTSTTPGGVTTSTTSTTDGTTTSTTTNTTSTSAGGVTTSTTSTTDGTTTSTTTNTTSTVGGVTSSTTTTTSGGTTSTEVCETTYGGMSSTTACTLTINGGSPTTYTSSTSTSGSGGDGSAGNGFDNPLGTGTSGTGSTGLTSPNTPGDYEITITPTDDCALPGKIKFTVNADGTISSSNVKYGLVGSSTYLGPLSEDVYTIDNVNSGLILHSTPKSILKQCVNGVKVATSSGSDFVLNKLLPSETLNVILPTTTAGVTFHNFELYNASGGLISSTVLTQGITNTIPVTGFPSTIPNGIYNFKFNVDITVSSTTTTQLVKGQLIIK
jgi:hypothetical protein